MAFGAPAADGHTGPVGQRLGQGFAGAAERVRRMALGVVGGQLDGAMPRSLSRLRCYPQLLAWPATAWSTDRRHYGGRGADVDVCPVTRYSRPNGRASSHRAAEAQSLRGVQRRRRQGTHHRACSQRSSISRRLHGSPIPSDRDASHTSSRLSPTGAHQRSTRLPWLRRPIGCSQPFWRCVGTGEVTHQSSPAMGGRRMPQAVGPLGTSGSASSDTSNPNRP